MYRFNKLNSSVLTLSCMAMAAAVSAPKAGGSVAPAPAPGGPAPTPAGPKAAPEPTVHPGLLTAIQKYDENIKQAETHYIEIIENVLANQISRADVVATLMKARGITFESAQSQYSRMKKIWEDPTVLEKLKSGDITLKVARELTTKKQAATGTATSGEGDGSSGSKTATTETKEARYERARKSHVASVKECGFDLKGAMLSFEADLKSAGVK